MYTYLISMFTYTYIASSTSPQEIGPDLDTAFWILVIEAGDRTRIQACHDTTFALHRVPNGAQDREPSCWKYYLWSLCSWGNQQTHQSKRFMPQKTWKKVDGRKSPKETSLNKQDGYGENAAFRNLLLFRRLVYRRESGRRQCLTWDVSFEVIDQWNKPPSGCLHGVSIRFNTVRFWNVSRSLRPSTHWPLQRGTLTMSQPVTMSSVKINCRMVQWGPIYETSCTILCCLTFELPSNLVSKKRFAKNSHTSWQRLYLQCSCWHRGPGPSWMGHLLWQVSYRWVILNGSRLGGGGERVQTLKEIVSATSPALTQHTYKRAALVTHNHDLW